MHLAYELVKNKSITLIATVYEEGSYQTQEDGIIFLLPQKNPSISMTAHWKEYGWKYAANMSLILSISMEPSMLLVWHVSTRAMIINMLFLFKD